MMRVPTILLLALSAPALAAGPVDYMVDTAGDTADAMPGDGLCADAVGVCTLRAAVQEANASAGQQTIALMPGMTYALLQVGPGEDAAATGDLDITDDLVVRGQGATIDAAGIDRIFDVMMGAELVVDDTTLRGGSVLDASGGAIRNAGTVRLRGSRVMDNTAAGVGASGGGLFNDGGYAEVLATTLMDNAATRAGGAIEANAGTTIVLRSVLAANSTGAAPGNGGALHLTGPGLVQVVETDVMGNTASAEGGGLWNSSDGQMTVDGCTITDNQADGMDADQGGGGLFNAGGTLWVTDSEVSGNRAMMGSGSGGGILNDQGVLYVVRTDVDGNVSMRAGGGIESVAGWTGVLRSSLSANTTGAAPGNGGGLHITGAGEAYVVSTDVLDNVASAEGGGLWNGSGRMQVIQSRVLRNTASGDGADQGGGGLFNAGGFLRVVNTRIASNTADGAAGSGGGVLNDQGELEIVRSDLVDNVSMRAGGGVEANVGWTWLRDVSLDGNGTGASPGNGGGLHLTGAGYVGVDRCSVTGNDAAAEGGGLWNSSTGTMEVTASSGGGNTAPVGANLFNDGGTFTVDGMPLP